jgi:hypothetical protein
MNNEKIFAEIRLLSSTRADIPLLRAGLPDFS